MLIILPPSETKRPPPGGGRPVDLESLSFPELTELRSRILDALIETSAGPDAFARLRVTPTKAEDVARNTWLRELPTMPAAEVYAGPLHLGLDATTLPEPAARRARQSVIVTSALWGALRLHDRIPPYRLDVCSALVGMGRLEPAWRTLLPDVLAAAATAGELVIEARSPSYVAIGRPTRLDDRTVILHVAQGSGRRRVGDVVAKRVRGEAVRHLLEHGADPADPDELATLLAERWPTSLARGSRGRAGWTISLSTSG
ncbi:MAG TPA: peroxide stress protein YaaA [Candidatus Limnocylindrales bacterium]|nr:peroxide stress protein YaaA [Candidatus Limnocylindrales bacterium]